MCTTSVKTTIKFVGVLSCHNLFHIIVITSARREILIVVTTPPRCPTCADRGQKGGAHASGSGSCPIFRAELRRLRGGK